MCPSKAVRMFPNQKLYFNRDIKMKIRKRRETFKWGDQVEYKRAGYELQKSIRAAKRAHSQKPEGYYVNHNTHNMWQEIKSTQSTTREPQLPQTTEMPPSQTALTPSSPGLTDWTQKHPQRPEETPRTLPSRWHTHKSLKLWTRRTTTEFSQSSEGLWGITNLSVSQAMTSGQQRSHLLPWSAW